MPDFLRRRLRGGLASAAPAIIAVGMAVTAPASATGLDRSLAQLEHTAWTRRDGAPENVSAIAQTSDGWLWLGTPAGLYRFDGKRFERFQPAGTSGFPDQDVYALRADAAGGLWIGWRAGGVSLVRGGVVRNWSVDDGLPRGSIWDLAADGPGLWAAGLDGLSYFDGRAWKKMGPQDGFKGRKASFVFVDAQGTVVTSSEQGLFLRPHGAARFEGPLGKLDPRRPPQQQRRADGSAGPVFVLEPRGIRIADDLRAYDRSRRPWIYRDKQPITGDMLADRAGALWYNDDRGLHRTTDPQHAAAPAGRAHAAGTESFGTVQGLSDGVVTCLFEDRDGNVWVGTKAGIDRFREVDIVHVQGPVKDWASLAPAPAGAVVATDGARAWRLQGASTHGLPGQSGDALTVDAGGSLWIGSVHGLERRSGDGARVLETIALPDGFSPIGKIHALARQADGTLWVSAVAGGALRRVGGRWEHPAMLPLAGKKTPLSMLADSKGRMWFGYIDGEVVLLDGASVRVFGKAQGLAVGKVALLFERDGAIFAGGTDGLARFEGARFAAVRVEPAHALSTLTGAAPAPDGVWLNGGAGVVKLDARALAGAPGGTARVFDDSDGLRGRTSILEVGTMTRAGDGRIWLATTSGVSWIDPAAVRPEALPYRPALLGVVADGRDYDAAQPLALPPAPQRVTFRYASPALAMPERIRYRYRLEGYDRGWQEAGAQTDAVYTGLPPGDYRFVVQAFNGAGAGGPASAPLPLHVQATLAQTAWFRVGCALLALAALWGMVRYRLRAEERRLLALERTRHAERDRIARELHDTLLQGVHGLIYHVDAAAAQAPARSPLRLQLEAALARAGEVVAEARDRVRDLRAGDRHDVDLAALLAHETGQAGALFGRTSGFAVEGQPYPVALEDAQACCRIVGEGLRNALRHGDARQVDVALAYAPDAVTVTVSDDGRGIDPDTLRDGKPGHWGLAGMRERAAMAGASLHIRSSPGAGTTLTLALPRRSVERTASAPA